MRSSKSDVAGALAPFLPKNDTKVPENRASVSGAVFNVSTSIMGAGIMSIPATMKVLGIVPAVILIAVVALLVDISVQFMMRYTYSGGSTTYAGLMNDSFGRFGSVAVQISVLIATLGCLIIYLIIIGDAFSGNGSGHLGVLQEWFGIHWWNSRSFALLFTVVFVMLPLVLLRRVESLRFSSAISVLLAVVFVGICLVMAIYAAIHGEIKTPKLLPNLDNQASFFHLFTAVPVIVTAFTFHFNVHAIGIELGSPSEMITAVRISLFLCGSIYIAVGIFGYLLFGESIVGDILVNFDQNSDSKIAPWLNDVVRLSYALHLVLVFPIVNFSLRTNLDELIFAGREAVDGKHTKRFLLLSFGLVAFSYLAAISFPDIWYFFQFIGSTAAVSLAFIFPGAIVLRDVHGIATTRDKVIGAVMIILAVITSTIAISSNVYSLIGNNNKS